MIGGFSLALAHDRGATAAPVPRMCVKSVAVALTGLKNRDIGVWRETERFSVSVRAARGELKASADIADFV